MKLRNKSNFILSPVVTIFIMMIALSACMTSTVIPEDRFYRLPDIHIDHANKKPVFSKALVVGKISAEGLYHERSMLYIDASHPLELRRYHYQYWTQTPSNLLQQYLIDYLHAVNASKRIVATQGIGDKNLGIIKGRLLRFERVMKPDKTTIQVSLVLQYHELGQTRLFEHEYQRDVAAADQSMQATVIAYSEALQQIFTAFLHDLTTH